MLFDYSKKISFIACLIRIYMQINFTIWDLMLWWYSVNIHPLIKPKLELYADIYAHFVDIVTLPLVIYCFLKIIVDLTMIAMGKKQIDVIKYIDVLLVIFWSVNLGI